jgi:hypothetical protein
VYCGVGGMYRYRSFCASSICSSVGSFIHSE